MAELLYSLCGWQLSSVIPMPDLPPWHGAAGAADVTIAIGAVPELEDTVMATPFLQVARDGRVRFQADGVATYLIERGNRITIAPDMPPEAPDVRLFLLGTGLGCLCHQRGLVPIHASTVEIDGAAVLFAGDSGAGKSTLADALSRRDYRVLSDDVSAVDLSVPGGLVVPSLRRIKLWQDAVDHAGWGPDALEQCRVGMRKFSRALHDTVPVKPLPPLAVFHLRRHSAKHAGATFHRLRGRAAVEEFQRQIYRARAMNALLGTAGATVRSIRAASVFPHHFIVERAIDFTRIDAGIDEIVATVRAARGLTKGGSGPR